MASGGGIAIELKGAEALIQRLGPELTAGPARNFLTRVAVQTQGYARINAPKDSGSAGLAGSIAFVVDEATPPAFAKVGTNIKHAKPMEYGTGLLSDAPDSNHQRHFPPGPALDRWAERHGWPDGWAVARAIANKGGLEPRRYMRKAFKQVAGNIPGFLRGMAQEIEALFRG